MTKKTLLCLLLAALLSFVLVSCCSTGDSQEANAKTAETDFAVSDTDPVDTDTEASPDDGTDTGSVLADEPREVYVCIRFGGKYYAQIRKSVWSDEFEADLSFKYLGEIGEKLENGDVIEGECVPQDTPVYVSEDGSYTRTVFGGAVYYCKLSEEPVPPETDEDGKVVTEAPGPVSKPAVLKYDDGFFHDDLQFKGETWEFKLDGDWRFVGVVGSVVSRKMYPEYDLEANADYFGKPVYYNEKLDRVAILVEDDNFAYSDIDWEIWVRSSITETE